MVLKQLKTGAELGIIGALGYLAYKVYEKNPFGFFEDKEKKIIEEQRKAINELQDDYNTVSKVLKRTQIEYGAETGRYYTPTDGTYLNDNIVANLKPKSSSKSGSSSSNRVSRNSSDNRILASFPKPKETTQQIIDRGIKENKLYSEPKNTFNLFDVLKK